MKQIKKGSNSFVQHWSVSYYWEWLGLLGLPWVAKMVKSLTAMQETQFQFLGQEDPLEKGMAIHSSILAWRILWTEEPGGLQSMGSKRVRHDLVTNTFTFHLHALEKEMATHSSVLAWRIPGTGESDGLPCMGSHRVGHDWSDLAGTAAAEFPIEPLFWKNLL